MRRKYIEEEIEALKNNIEFVEHAKFLSVQKKEIKAVLEEALSTFQNKDSNDLLVENIYENLPYIYSLINLQNVNRSKRLKISN